jgi:hypothetical protein
MDKDKRDTEDLVLSDYAMNLPEARADKVCVDCLGKRSVTRDGRFCLGCLRKRINKENPIERRKPPIAGMRGYKARSSQTLGGSAELLNDGDGE